MEVTQDESGAISVITAAYRLEVHAEHPVASLTDANGESPMRIFLLAGIDTDRGLDSTVAVGAPRMERLGPSPAATGSGADDVPAGAAGCVISLDTTSTIWSSKQVRLRCSEDEVAFEASVSGEGRLSEIRLLGGWYTGNPRWGGGRFHSRWAARTVFDPSPDDPRRIVQPASEPAAIGVVGGSQPGRGHWFFTPAPFIFAGSSAATDDPDDPAAAPWTTLELHCAVADANFTELRYAPFLGGFSLELAYDGQTAVDGSFTTPPLVIRHGARNPYEALARHAARLRADGLAPTVPRDQQAWWRRPIFCGWGEQCREARHRGEHPTAQSRREHYDRWLGTLRDNGIVPGTIVIDDRWQASYGRNEPDQEHWPDLRGWIAARHTEEQRVLLWFKAWDPEGLPLDACITDSRGQPVAADPDSPTYQAILRDSLRAMLTPDGLAADGLKVDFTAQTPAGPGLRHAGDAWGVALLHRLLELVYRFAKQANPEALIVTHTATPLFADVADMIRLNDLLRLDEPEPFAAAVPQMRHRARVAASVDPGLLIDTDDWCMPSKAEWRAYLAAKPDLGVPALYYATGIDHSDEAFGPDDYAAIRDAWSRYEARVVQETNR